MSRHIVLYKIAGRFTSAVFSSLPFREQYSPVCLRQGG